eukprot:3740376-Pleurochrysis_carterae.AAC.1
MVCVPMPAINGIHISVALVNNIKFRASLRRRQDGGREVNGGGVSFDTGTAKVSNGFPNSKVFFFLRRSRGGSGKRKDYRGGDSRSMAEGEHY